MGFSDCALFQYKALRPGGKTDFNPFYPTRAAGTLELRSTHKIGTINTTLSMRKV
jgi:hypothetical protein